MGSASAGAGGVVGVVRVRTRLNVRSGPSTRYRIIGKLYPGERVRVLGSRGRWYKIAWRGGIGWAYGRYISTRGASPPPAY